MGRRAKTLATFILFLAFAGAPSARALGGLPSSVPLQPGVGKTGLASGLLLKALQNGYRGLFIKAQDLFDEMYASIADRASRKLIRRWARLDILLID